MKKSFKLLMFTGFLISFIAISQIGQSQSPPPPPGEKGSSENKTPLQGPIDGGLTVFLAFAAGYVGKEWAKSRKNKIEVAEN
ncbi:MAG: hypothetical protein WCP32_08360 [Bacteroidota bacterium]